WSSASTSGGPRRTVEGGSRRLLRRSSESLYSAVLMAKIKMKSNSSAKKRFKLTANGRVKRKKAYLRHCLTHKTASAKRRLRRGGYVSKTQEHQIKAMLPYA